MSEVSSRPLSAEPKALSTTVSSAYEAGWRIFRAQNGPRARPGSPSALEGFLGACRVWSRQQGRCKPRCSEHASGSPNDEINIVVYLSLRDRYRAKLKRASLRSAWEKKVTTSSRACLTRQATTWRDDSEVGLSFKLT
jgi:hypothetical protein